MIFSNLTLNFSPILFFPIVQCSKIPWYQFELHGSTIVQTSPLSYLFRCSEICYQKWLGLLILGPPLSRVFLHSKNLIPSFKLVSYYQFVLKIPVPPLHVPTCPHTPPPPKYFAQLDHVSMNPYCCLNLFYPELILLVVWEEAQPPLPSNCQLLSVNSVLPDQFHCLQPPSPICTLAPLVIVQLLSHPRFVPLPILCLCNFPIGIPLCLQYLSHNNLPPYRSAYFHGESFLWWSVKTSTILSLLSSIQWLHWM